MDVLSISCTQPQTVYSVQERELLNVFKTAIAAGIELYITQTSLGLTYIIELFESSVYTYAKTEYIIYIKILVLA